MGYVRKPGLSRPFWKAMALSFLVFWALDLLTSGILIWSGFGSLEGNASVRSFFTAPTMTNLTLFVQNQSLYLVPLLFLVAPPAIERLNKGEPQTRFYLLSGFLAFAFAADRLNLGIASNSANLLAIAEEWTVPASGSVYYALWGVFDASWAVSVSLFLYTKRSRFGTQP